jgi:hypothetical protein
VTNLATWVLSMKVPGPANEPIKAMLEGYGKVTSRARTLPDFIIIGGQRCATSSLHLYLCQHPAVGAPSLKEVHFFDLNFSKGMEWYRLHFPTRAYAGVLSRLSGLTSITGEGSPYYMLHPRVPYRVADTLPNVRLIAMLRDPVSRLISHYHHERALGFENLSLREALDREDERLAADEVQMRADPLYIGKSHQHHSYRARGRYAEQLERWFDVFDREQIMIIETKRFFADPTVKFDEVLGFLGLPPVRRTHFESYNSLRYDDVDPKIRHELQEYFRPHNERLYELLGEDYGW